MSETTENAEIAEPVTEEPTDANNEFAYLDREHFTSEKFKIEVRNLPKYYGMPELKKLFNKKLNLETNKLKVPYNGSKYLFVCFRSEEARKNALQVLNGYKWKGQILKAVNSSAVPDPVALKRRTDNRDNRSDKKQKFDENDGLSDIERLKNATSPLWNKPYEEQLEIKTKKVKNILKQLGKSLEENSEIKEYIRKQCELYDGLPCELLPIRPSPIINGYRNKCEFTIGLNEATGEKTVGMRVCSYSKGSLCVVSADQLPLLPEIMKKACNIFEKFIRGSNLDIYNQETHQGYWQTLTARYGFRTNELMLILTTAAQKLDENEVKTIQDDLRNFLENVDESELVVHSLWLELAINRQQTTYHIVKGDNYIHEEVCGKKFRISPQSFFQPNTEATDVLYNAINDLSANPGDSCLVDICCGAGTIGLCLSEHFNEIIGLEKCVEAVEDAKHNAQINNVTNAQFFAGSAEEILSACVYRAKHPNIVAVVDPPRAGLERHAISQLRRLKNLNQFVYASCNPQLALKNFIDFGRKPSKQYPNDPFLPVKCVPVDMLPHTDGCEIVIFFQRSSLLIK